MPDISNPVPVLVTVRFEDDLLAQFREVSRRVELLYYPARTVSEVPDTAWNFAEVLYTTGVIPDPALAPRLRWVHIHHAGVDHVLDEILLQMPDILLTTSSGIHATNIAEYVFMMMLAHGHRLLKMLRFQAEARWPESGRFQEFMPLELRGSTLGIVGYGSIGREIARLAHQFGMEVLAIKREVRQPAERDEYTIPGTGDPQGEHFDRLYPPEALASMVSACDFVVLAVPLTPATRRMFGAEAFRAMKSTAFLINVGRGGVVDEAALLDALTTGQIAGAAMDVFENEPLPADSPLWKQPNLIISPHISGNTADYNQKAAALFVENLHRYIGRKELLNLVDRTRGY